MEISGNGRAIDLANLLLGVHEVERLGGKKLTNDAPRHDQVEISEHAKEIQRIKALVNAPDTARTERIEQLRKALDSGTYDINGRKVADALIRHILTDAIL